MIGQLFRQTELVPIRRPHPSDEVVANLDKHSSSILSKDYLRDAESLRDTVVTNLLPVHRCSQALSNKDAVYSGNFDIVLDRILAQFSSSSPK